MNAEDDLSAALPHPPLARPAAREAAIAAALRRYDGERDTAAERGRPAAAWWSGIARPHVAAMAAVTLVAVVGLPVMMSGDHRLNPPPASIERAAPVPAEPAVMADVAPPPVAERAAPVSHAEVSPADLPTRDPSIRAESAPAPTSSAPALAVPAPPPAVQAYAAPPPPPAPVMAPPAIAAREATARDIAVSESRMRQAVGEDIVVTASRMVPRGDWNACTVDDPRRDLSACKRAAGPPGTPLAEGLAKAWDGDPDAAVAAFDRAIATAPKSAFAWLNRGIAHARAGDDDAALADLDRAVRRAPHAARGYYQRSLVLRQRGETKRAERDEQRALELDPDYGAVIE